MVAHFTHFYILTHYILILHFYSLLQLLLYKYYIIFSLISRCNTSSVFQFGVFKSVALSPYTLYSIQRDSINDLLLFAYKSRCLTATKRNIYSYRKPLQYMSTRSTWTRTCLPVSLSERFSTRNLLYYFPYTYPQHSTSEGTAFK